MGESPVINESTIDVGDRVIVLDKNAPGTVLGIFRQVGRPAEFQVEYGEQKSYFKRHELRKKGILDGE